MSKVLVKIYNSYGKWSGKELLESFVDVDSPELRASLVDDYFWSKDDVFESIDNFVKGVSSSIYGGSDGGDWDEPTGREIVILTKEEQSQIIVDTYQSDLAELEHMFK